MSDETGDTKEDRQGDGGAARRKSRAGDVTLGKYVRIDPSTRLPRFDRPHARAFAASDSREPGESVYAVVCTEEVPPRMDVLTSLARIDGLPFVVPLDWGPVAWDGNGNYRFAVVFEQPAGEPLAKGPGAPMDTMREEQVIERVVRPISRVLAELDARGIPHRAICAQNVFFGEGSREVTLGECVGAPAGMVQPTLYETIEAGMASPEGRGQTSLADDYYALGALIAVLLAGDTMPGWSDRDIVTAKIEKGSYAALLGRTRLSLKMMEPMRGLLCDDADERWQQTDLEMWLNGRQLSPKQVTLARKTRRAFKFGGEEYWTCRGLAHALAHDWSGGLRVLGSGELENWAARSLSDEEHANTVRTALAGSQAVQSGQGEDRALARALIALDPPAPIRMKSVAARVEALGQAIALDYEDTEKRNQLADAILSKLPQRWLELKGAQLAMQPQLIQQFERMAFFLGRNQIGYGAERVLYEYNPDWPCLSPLVRGRYVSSVDRLLPALEAVAAQGPPEGEPVDRHIAAFCAARMKPSPDRIVQGLGKSGDDAERHRAMLHLLADLQHRTGLETAPALCKWVVKFVDPVVEALHNRKVKEKARKKVSRAVESGSLIALVEAADSPETRRRDAEGFAAAQSHYGRLAAEITWLEDGGLTSDQHVAWASRGAATAISALCSGLLLVLLTVYYVS